MFMQPFQGLKVSIAYYTFVSTRFPLVFLNHFLLESSSELTLLLSLFVYLLLLIVLFLKLFVLGCVAMLCVQFLALKAFTADSALELISDKEALWLRV